MITLSELLNGTLFRTYVSPPQNVDQSQGTTSDLSVLVETPVVNMISSNVLLNETLFRNFSLRSRILVAGLSQCLGVGVVPSQNDTQLLCAYILYAVLDDNPSDPSIFEGYDYTRYNANRYYPFVYHEDDTPQIDLPPSPVLQETIPSAFRLDSHGFPRNSDDSFAFDLFSDYDHFRMDEMLADDVSVISEESDDTSYDRFISIQDSIRYSAMLFVPPMATCAASIGTARFGLIQGSGLFGFTCLAIYATCSYSVKRYAKRLSESTRNNWLYRRTRAFVEGAAKFASRFVLDMFHCFEHYPSIMDLVSKKTCEMPSLASFVGIIGVIILNVSCQTVLVQNFGVPIGSFVSAVLIAPVVEEYYKMKFNADSYFALTEFILSGMFPWRITAFWMHHNLPSIEFHGQRLSYVERVLYHMGFNFIASLPVITVPFLAGSLFWKGVSGYFLLAACHTVFYKPIYKNKDGEEIHPVPHWLRWFTVSLFLACSYGTSGSAHLLYPGIVATHVAGLIALLSKKSDMVPFLSVLNEVVLYSYANMSCGFIFAKDSNGFHAHFMFDALASPTLNDEELQNLEPGVFVPDDANVYIHYWCTDSLGVSYEDKSLNWWVTGKMWNRLMHSLFGNIDREEDDFDFSMDTLNPVSTDIVDLYDQFKLNPQAQEFVPAAYAKPIISNVAELKSALAGCFSPEMIAKMLKNQYDVRIDAFAVQREVRGRLRAIEEHRRYSNPDVLGENGRDKQAALSKFIANSHGRHRDRKGFTVHDIPTPYVKNTKVNTNNIYRVPLIKVPHPIMPKPNAAQAKRNPYSVKMWISSIGFRSLPQRLVPYKAVCGNEACRLLMTTPNYTNYSDKDLQDLLDRCSLSYQDMRSIPVSAPAPLQLSDFMDMSKLETKRSLVGGGVICYSVEDMEQIKPFFKKDRPIFKACCAYLADGILPLGGSLSRLKSDFNRVMEVKVVKQGKEEEEEKTHEDMFDTPLDFVFEEISTAVDMVRTSGFLGLARLLSMLFGMYRANTRVEMLNIFFLYVSSPDVAKIPEVIIQGFQECFKKVVTTQGLDFKGKIPTTPGDAIFDIISSLSVWNMMSMFETSEWSLVRYACLTIKAVMSKARPKEGETLIAKVLRFIQEGFQLVKKFVETRDWNVFFQPYDTIDSWSLRAKALLDYRPNVVSDRGLGGDSDKEFKRLKSQKLIPESWLVPFTDEEYEDELVRCITLGEEFMKLYRSTDREKHVGALVIRLRAYKSQTNAAHNVMANRVAPLGVTLWGDAGVGKTGILYLIINAIARKQGFPMSPEYVHFLQMNSNFQDGANSTQWVWVGDDIDQNPAPNVAGVENHCTWVIKICNNAALPIESAAVELKGKICGRPLVYLNTTNFEKARLQPYLLFPPAYYRRMSIRVRVTVKPEFANEWGALNTQAAESATTPSMWIFEVQKYDGSKYDKTNPFSCCPFTDVPGSPMELPAFLQFINQEFEEHLRVQKLVVAQTQRGESACEICLATLKPGQTCCAVTQQGGLEYIKLFNAGVPLTRALLLDQKLSLLTGLAMTSGYFAYRFGRIRLSKYVAEHTAVIADTIVNVKNDIIQARQAVSGTMSFLSNAAKISAAIGVAMQALKLLRELYAKYVLKQGLVDNKTEKPQVSYVKLDQSFDPAFKRVATYTKDELIDSIKLSMVKVYNRSTNMNMHAFYLAHDAIMCPAHLGKLGDTISISRGSFSVDVVLCDFNTTVHEVKDYMIVRCSHLTGIKSNVMAKIWPDIDFAVVNYDECLLVGPDTTVQCLRPHRVSYSGAHYVNCDPCTADGDCGKLYAARINDQWFIIGMHVNFLKMTFKSESSGVLFGREEIKAFGQRVQTTLQGVVCPVGQFPKAVEVGPYPEKKSEVLAAITQRGVVVSPIGMAAPKIVGATMVSKVHPTIFAEEFEDLEVKWCGRKDHWQIPNFKGAMVDGKWESWYVNGLMGLNRTNPDECYLMLSVLDYIGPLIGARTTGYRDLSDNEVIVGIPSSVVNPVNLNTSTGLPFATKKRPFFTIVDAVASVDSRLWSVWKTFREVVDDGRDLAVPVSVVTLKDEPISAKKNESYNGRPFNVLTCAYNFETKKRMAPVKAFMRANPLLTECAVGINVGSNEMDDVFNHLASVDPGRERIVEADYWKIDKTTTGVMFHYCSITLSFFSWLIGGDWRKLRSLILAGRHVVYVINNDMYQSGGENSSGNDATVEINSVNNSVSNRYVHYRRNVVLTPAERARLIEGFSETVLDPSALVRLYQHFEPMLNFRQVYAMITYGDDLLKAHSRFGTLDREEELFLELGYVMTDGQKNKGLCYRSWDQVTFLKRTYYRDAQTGLLFCPLTLKTLAKMLRMSNDSTLSRTDHGAQLMSDVLRESVYHGEEFYGEMLSRILAVAEKYGLLTNDYFVYKTYEEYVEDIELKRFKTWTSPEDLKMLI